MAPGFLLRVPAPAHNAPRLFLLLLPLLVIMRILWGGAEPAHHPAVPPMPCPKPIPAPSLVRGLCPLPVCSLLPVRVVCFPRFRKWGEKPLRGGPFGPLRLRRGRFARCAYGAKSALPRCAYGAGASRVAPSGRGPLFFIYYDCRLLVDNLLITPDPQPLYCPLSAFSPLLST